MPPSIEPDPPPASAGGHAVFEGGGEMGALMRSFDWSTTPVGDPEAWPRSLQTIVSIVLRNRFPMFLWWGPELVQFYNDAYRPSLGGDGHPRALGASGRAFWAEIWPVIGPLVERVKQGDSTWAEHQLIPITRDGWLQEVFWTFSYTPVPDDDGRIAGVLVTCQETTAQIQDERQLRVQRDLAGVSSTAASAAELAERAARVLAEDDADVPFALMYLMDDDGETARLVSTVRLEDHPSARPATVDLTGDASGPWPLAEARRRGRPVVVSELRARVGDLPGGCWDAPPEEAIVLPLGRPGQSGHSGFLVSGVSVRRALDERYTRFFSLVADQLTAGIAGVHAYQQEKERAESLAELDRAKTLFFSSVSHELRTPLMLMLGPLADALDEPERIALEHRRGLEMAQRNGARLLELVNSLLDFSRIEAGRIEASYEPTDLGSFTAELASLFRSAIERVGLRFVVDSPPLDAPVYVDRSMWEKIVFNLVSNAFKFTFDGEIEVALRSGEDAVALSVRDTGTGIPREELPRLFDRFHRIEGARGRSIEGSGIGLALVEELARLHGGEVRVESEVGRGSVFTVSVPRGARHLPADRIASEVESRTARDAPRRPVLSWVPSESIEKDEHRPAREAPSGASARAVGSSRPPRILLADDNPDLREYLGRLLSDDYDVEAVSDGRAALAAARAHRPDLVLSDAMMPDVDGFELLRALRSDEDLAAVPVILLSARAGEEARLEGIEAGADDYLAKPFSGRELRTRVASRLELAQLQRRLDEERVALQRVFAQTPVPTAILRGEELTFELANAAYEQVVGRRELGGQPLLEAMPELAGQGFDDLLRGVMRSGRAHVGTETLVRLDRQGTGVIEDCYFTFIYAPLRDAAGAVDGVVAIVTEVTEQVRARALVERSASRYRHIFETARVSIWEEDFSEVKAALDALKAQGVTDLRDHLEARPELVRDLIGRVRVVDVNERTVRLFGADDKAALLESLHRVFVPESEPMFVEELVAVAEGRRFVEREMRLRRLDGEPIDVLAAVAFPSGDAALESVLVTLVDITDRKRAEESLREADRRKDEFLAMLGHELRNPLAAIRSATELVKETTSDNPHLRRARDVLDRQSAHVARLIDGLLEVSRVSRGKIALEPRSVDLPPLVERVLRDQRDRLARQELTLERDITDAPLWVWADDVRLVQVFDNLLTNAIKFTPAGGTITATVRRDGDHALVELRDTGAGIGPDVLARVFEPFQQEAQDVARGSGGLGLGLALVKGLVELHHGRVRAQSEGRGEGATFSVWLPLSEPPGAREEMARSTAGAARRVLVVEDNEDAAEMLRVLLELRGHDVAVASRGAEAVTMLRARGADVVLCDIGLPGMDGYAVAREIRSDPSIADTVLVALTGYGQPEDRQRTREAGFDEHLVKPVRLAMIDDVLERLGGGRSDEGDA